MKHPHAISLATRLIESRLRKNGLQTPLSTVADAVPEAAMPLNTSQRDWAIGILSTHLDACLRHGVKPDLREAVDEAVEFARRHETAYDPIPESARWHSALVIMEEVDAD
ncbi:MAG: hypothetical protein ACKV2V_12655 [Blastocatellia bacterium]